MNRRNFLSLVPAAVAGLALDQAIPFNRVWSFPKNVRVPHFSATRLRLMLLPEPEVFDPLSRVIIREAWHKKGNVVFRRTEVRQLDGSYKPLNDWQPTGLPTPPFDFIEGEVSSIQPFLVTNFETELSVFKSLRAPFAAPRPSFPIPAHRATRPTQNAISLRS
jgi:hypothetical protein